MNNQIENENTLPFIGWREWCGLPELGIERLKCKIDTGARTSSLDAKQIEVDSTNQQVRFVVQPFLKQPHEVIHCEARLIDQRRVANSSGFRESRYVIQTLFSIGLFSFPIELTLADRSTMRFSMLLGRAALQNNFIINPASTYLLGKKNNQVKY